ncbi:hypothetical protein ACSSS7_007384 [Eimeria intestinalis]
MGDTCRAGGGSAMWPASSGALLAFADAAAFREVLDALAAALVGKMKERFEELPAAEGIWEARPSRFAKLEKQWDDLHNGFPRPHGRPALGGRRMKGLSGRRHAGGAATFWSLFGCHGHVAAPWPSSTGGSPEDVDSHPGAKGLGLRVALVGGAQTNRSLRAPGAPTVHRHHRPSATAFRRSAQAQLVPFLAQPRTAANAPM